MTSEENEASIEPTKMSSSDDEAPEEDLSSAFSSSVKVLPQVFHVGSFFLHFPVLCSFSRGQALPSAPHACSR